MNTFLNNFIIFFVLCMIYCFSLSNTYALTYYIGRCIMFVVVKYKFLLQNVYLNIDKYYIISNTTDVHELFLYIISVDICRSTKLYDKTSMCIRS